MEAAISQVFTLALAHHQAGRLEEAARLYRQLLVETPTHVSALNNLGLIVPRDEALPLFQAAVSLNPTYVDALLNLAAAQAALGRPDEAAAGYRRVLALRPDHPEARQALDRIRDELNRQGGFARAAALHQAGRLAEAEALYRWCLVVDGDNLSALNNLGLIVPAGEAEALFRRAIALKSDYVDAHVNLGATLEAAGRLDEAVASYLRALEITPAATAVLCRLGLVCQSQGRLDQAEAHYRQALAFQPALAEAHNNLGVILKDLGRPGLALACLEQALAIRPDYPEALLNMGNALRNLDRQDEAIGRYEQALAVRPDHAPTLFSLGVLLQSRGKVYDAMVRYERAVAVKPDFYEALNNLGLGLKDQGRLGDAIVRLTQALAVRPDYLDAVLNLGNTLKDQGRYDEALARYDQALGIKPDFAGALHNRLFTLACLDTLPAEAVIAEHVGYGTALMARTPGPPAPFANPREAGRRLRVGYVSPDFRRHSVSYFLEPLLSAHDHQGFEIFAYAEVSLPDEVTARFRAQADHWLVTVGMGDEALAARIRLDGIDILVDCAGHTAGNRLPLFARRPAPIQVTWLGYPNTTGIPTLDYRLVDAVTDPPSLADALATETLVRLPGGFLCFAPPAESPPPGPPPVLAGGAVTFGSFNNPAKISPSTLETWAAILKRLPQARLLLKGRQLADPMTCALMRDRFAGHGIAADRLEMLGFLPDTGGHLKIYDRIDIGLDPFPYNGTTTTCEALWMGVPTITLAGDRHAGRVGASLLTRVGLDDLIAADRDDYVERAVTLAGATERLIMLRSELRPRMAASTLCDPAAFARGVEAAYRAMWRRWLDV